MTDRFDFGLADIVQSESTSNTLARGGASFLTLAFLVLSGVTTFGFFSRYAESVGSFAGPAAAPIVAGVIGVLALDIGCLLWAYVRSHAATSGMQMTVALVASICDLCGALACSALFIVLSTSLETGIRGPGGELTQFGELVNFGGVAVMVGALLINFTAVFLWVATSSATRAAEQQTQLRAIVAAGQFRVDNARTQMLVARTIENIGAQLPAEVDRLAGRKSQEYIASTMSTGRPASQAEPAPMHSVNGNGAVRPM